MPQLVSLDAATPADEVMEVLRRDGAVVLAGLISPAEADMVRNELMPFVEATPPGRDAFTGTKTTRTGALVARSPKTRKLVLDPRIRASTARIPPSVFNA